MSNPNWIGRPEKNYAKPLPGQLELATVIDHQVGISQIGREEGDVYLARQIAKMLSQYDDQPSSQLWGDIQRLAREILK